MDLVDQTSRADPHRLALRRELECVVDETGDHQGESLVIGEHALRIRRDGDRKAFPVRALDEARDHLAEHTLELD